MLLSGNGRAPSSRCLGMQKAPGGETLKESRKEQVNADRERSSALLLALASIELTAKAWNDF